MSPAGPAAQMRVSAGKGNETSAEGRAGANGSRIRSTSGSAPLRKTQKPARGRYVTEAVIHDENADGLGGLLLSTGLGNEIDNGGNIGLHRDGTSD
jgi:hypothetical protein